MFLKKFKPFSAGLRHKIKTIIPKYKKFKKKIFQFRKINVSGRNYSGKIIVRHHGGAKRKILYFYWNFNLRKVNSGIIVAVYKSSFSTAFFGLLKYLTGSYTYILLPHKTWLGSLIIRIYHFEKNLTMSCFIERALLFYTNIITFLRNLDISFIIYNVCLINNAKSQYGKAAGVFCKIFYKNLDCDLILIQLPTFIKKWLNGESLVITGRVSNIFHRYEVAGKAGFSRSLNIRPTVRGVAMNPVDHPHGGRTKSNSPEVTPWGKIAKFSK